MKSVISLSVALLIPFMIIMCGVQLLLTQTFLDIEYRMPWFPADTHGFTREERLTLAHQAVNYLTGKLESLDSVKKTSFVSAFNDREARHLKDVKAIIQPLLMLWRLCLMVLVLLFLICWNLSLLTPYCKGTYYGAWLTVILLTAVTAMGSLGFDQLFTGFHELFFTGDSWLFNENDTLIRLFPIRFWQDGLLYIVLFSSFISIIMIFACAPSGAPAQ